jgi:glycosyltransferase involved in cell wall biosynthesis
MGEKELVHRIAILGTHLPRRCGIATFGSALGDAIERARHGLDCFAIAVNDVGHQHAYPKRVKFEITESDLVSYRRASDFLNVKGVDVLSLQHEYGIFGGKAGSHLLTLLRGLRMPIVSTLHTILEAPNERQRRVMDELTELSARLVVMTAQGAELLREVHQVPTAKIDVIPHGIAQVAEGDNKEKLGVAGRQVLLTFGLLSPDKGIEHVIDAMPEILARHPDAIYIVLGTTHPHVRDRYGEAYRLGLASRVARLGLEASVIFHDRFVDDVELAEFLSVADVYVTPYLNMQQSTSGTLAYAVGAGRAVISTPYRHAKELLADGRGILVPEADPAAIAREVCDLLSDDVKRERLRERALAYGSGQHWPAVARSYIGVFDRACAEHNQRGRTKFYLRSVDARPAELPEVNFDHVRALSDHTGILQHAHFNVPAYAEGYSLDDNARALLLMALAEDAGTDKPKLVRALASRYLAFVRYAFVPEGRRFRNFMSYARKWEDRIGSDDCHGRAMWALGTVVGRSTDPGRGSLAGWLFQAGLAPVLELASPRAWAYTLLGIAEYLRAFWGDSQVQTVQRKLAQRLVESFRRVSTPDWQWFEDRVTYCNARLPQALIVTAEWLDDAAMQDIGVRALDWLITLQTTDDYFSPIGCNGFYVRGQPRARFDQQPVEAGSTVSACLDARRATGDPRWFTHARRAFDWFLGANELRRSLYDPASGACHDGLHADRLNQNQGAESTLSFLLALLELRTPDRTGTIRRPVGPVLLS